MVIAGQVVIARPIGEVFAFVADARNDPRWCRKVRSVEQVAGEGPGPGARYSVVHKPLPLRPPRRMAHTCRAWEPPRRIDWHEDDGADTIGVTYTLEPLDRARTRLTQRDDARLGTPRLLLPVMRAGIAADLRRQLRALKDLLER